MIPIARPEMGEQEKAGRKGAEVVTVMAAVNAVGAEPGPLDGEGGEAR